MCSTAGSTTVWAGTFSVFLKKIFLASLITNKHSEADPSVFVFTVAISETTH